MNLVERFVTERSGPAFVDGWSLRGSIVLTPRYPDSRHVVVLLLDQDGHARLVGKVVRAPRDPSTLDREAAVLTAVGFGPSMALRSSVPRLLALEWAGHHRLMVQTAVAGTPLTHRSARRHPALWWHRVEAWIDGLPRTPTTAAGVGWLDRYIGADIGLARETLAGVGAMNTDLERGFVRTIDSVRRLRDATPHLVVEHGDLSHPNVLWSAKGLSAVDWETGDPQGLPGVDAATFLCFLAFAEAGAHGVEPERAAYRRALLTDDGSGRRRLSRHLEDNGMAADLIDDILLTAWGKAALSAFSRLLTGSGQHSPAARERAVERFMTAKPYALWSATLAK